MASRIDYQGRLGKTLATLFPNHDIKENVRKKAGISSGSGVFLELDYWIPSLKVAFEYQDPYHYSTTWFQTPTTKVQVADRNKTAAVISRKETLIPVPYWWDGEKASLVATIKQARPDLLPDFVNLASPISTQPPEPNLKEYCIPGIGELMLVSFPAFADGSDFSLRDWWVSEKYDGFRSCWTQTTKMLYSRFGRPLYISKAHASSFPDICLDGEIWLGRSTFQESCTTYRSALNNDVISPLHWLRMNVFDSPAVEVPFETRYHSLLLSVPACHPFAIVVSNMKPAVNDVGLLSARQIDFIKNLVIRDHGEGIVLRSQTSSYYSGRSSALLKYKAHRDQDGLVIEGDTTSQSDLVHLLLPSGEKCVAINDSGVAVVPGDIVTFSYKFLSGAGQATNCYIQRKREDVEWRNLVRMGANRVVANETGPSYSTLSTSSPQHGITAGTGTVYSRAIRKPPGFWSSSDNHSPSNVRLFFDKIARDNNIDGSVPENWFSFTKNDILREEGGASILKHFSSSIRLALADAYPDSIGVVADDIVFRTGFSNLPGNLWIEKWRRKQFLEEFAAQQGFSPQDYNSWKGISEEDIKLTKAGLSFMRYCARQQTTLEKEIDDCFFHKLTTNVPNVNDLAPALEISFNSTKEMRGFFESVATSVGFDYSVGGNWYANFQAVQNIVLYDKRGTKLLHHFSGSVAKAISSLFPELHLVDSKFETYTDSKKLGQIHTQKRYFFANMAKNMRFDPLVVSNWYSVSIDTILSAKGCNRVVYPGATVVSMLQDAFPELEFTPTLFKDRNEII